MGDAEGVLNTGKLAEASPLDHLILPIFAILFFLNINVLLHCSDLFVFAWPCVLIPYQESNIGNIAVLCYLLLGETKRALEVRQYVKPDLINFSA